MHGWDYECGAYDGDIYCVECLPEGVNHKDPDSGFYPIFATDEVDSYPVCCECGTEHDYMGLTCWGLEQLEEYNNEEKETE